MFVSETRDVNAVKSEIVDSLINFLDETFSISDDHDISNFKPFVDLENSADIKLIHNIFFEDLPLEELGMEYPEAVHLQNIDQIKCMPLQYKLKRLLQSGFFPNVAFAAKPRSVDVQRLISVSTALKSTGRARIFLETENLNLYVHYNMPTVEELDPRPAVEIWLTSRSRRCRDRPKGRKQTYFKGIFLQSDEESNDQDQPTRKRKEQF